jgi:hypothetical protein
VEPHGSRHNAAAIGHSLVVRQWSRHRFEVEPEETTMVDPADAAAVDEEEPSHLGDFLGRPGDPPIHSIPRDLSPPRWHLPTEVLDENDLIGQLGGDEAIELGRRFLALHFERVHGLMPQLGGTIAVELSRKIAAKRRKTEGERLAEITRLVALKFR